MNVNHFPASFLLGAWWGTRRRTSGGKRFHPTFNPLPTSYEPCMSLRWANIHCRLTSFQADDNCSIDTTQVWGKMGLSNHRLEWETIQGISEKSSSIEEPAIPEFEECNHQSISKLKLKDVIVEVMTKRYCVFIFRENI